MPEVLAPGLESFSFQAELISILHQSVAKTMRVEIGQIVRFKCGFENLSHWLGGGPSLFGNRWNCQQAFAIERHRGGWKQIVIRFYTHCLLYTSPSPRDRQKSRMPSSA